MLSPAVSSYNLNATLREHNKTAKVKRDCDALGFTLAHYPQGRVGKSSKHAQRTRRLSGIVGAAGRGVFSGVQADYWAGRKRGGTVASKRRKKSRAVTNTRCNRKVESSSSERPGCDPCGCSLLKAPFTKFLPSSLHSLRSRLRNGLGRFARSCRRVSP